MRLSAREFRELERQARLMARHNPTVYLAEAMEALRHTDDPVDVLVLLVAMWNAARDKQRGGLNAVGCWLEQRLLRVPSPPMAQLVLELGWLRRMVRQAPAADAGERTASTSACYRPRRQRPDFGSHLDSVRTRWQQTANETRPGARVDSPATVAPRELPPVFAAQLVDLPAARKAWKKQRERARKGRPAKDRSLAIAPVDGQLAALASDIECSLLRTEGMSELFERMAASGGKQLAFLVRVQDLESGSDKRRLALRILFEDS